MARHSVLVAIVFLSTAFHGIFSDILSYDMTSEETVTTYTTVITNNFLTEGVADVEDKSKNLGPYESNLNEDDVVVKLMNSSVEENFLKVTLLPDNKLKFSIESSEVEKLEMISARGDLNLKFNEECLYSTEPCQKYEIKECLRYSTVLISIFKDQSKREIPYNFTTNPIKNGDVTKLSLVSSDSKSIRVGWEAPKCNATLPIANYSITAESKSGKNSNKKPQTFSAKDVTSFKISNLEPCTEYNITIRPAYNDVQWVSKTPASSLFYTTRSLDDKVTDFSAVWRNDDLLLTWRGLDCTRNLTDWRLTVFNGSKPINIPTSCTHRGTNQHRIELKFNESTIICHDGENVASQTLDYPIEACVSYNFSLTPVFDSEFTQQEHSSTVSVKVDSLIKRPSRPGVKNVRWFESQGKLFFAWLQPKDNPKCLSTFEYTLNYDLKKDHVEKTINTSIELELKPCMDYSIHVWSIDKNGNKSNDAVKAIGKTSSAGIDFPGILVHEEEFNQSCFKINWKFSSGDLSENTKRCIGFFQIHLQPPLEGKQSYWRTVDGTIMEQVVCNLQAGVEYRADVQLVTVDGKPQIPSETISFVTESPPTSVDTATIGLIVVIILLVLVVICVGVYVTRPWCLRSPRHSRSFQSTFRRLTFLGSFGRCRSHPIKLRNLPTVTQRLCSSAGHKMEMEFEDLNIISEARRLQAVSVAAHPENKNKNRYVNILPYDHSRVQLNLLPDDPHSDYINASYIMGFSGSKDYIATQGPKDCTMKDFWRMIWEQDIRVIAMVTALEERGKSKCDQYWPDDEGEPMTFGGFTVEPLDAKEYENYTLRNFKIKMGDENRKVIHIYFKGWPDFGCPQNPEILLQFIELIRSLTAEDEASVSVPPILVHCSAGVGRTGTLIAVDWLMQEARVSKEVDIFSTVLRMRECRPNMIQSEDQYEFVYKCLTHFVNTRLQLINGNGDLENSPEADNLLKNGHNNQLIEPDVANEAV